MPIQPLRRAIVLALFAALTACSEPAPVLLGEFKFEPMKSTGPGRNPARLSFPLLQPATHMDVTQAVREPLMAYCEGNGMYMFNDFETLQQLMGKLDSAASYEAHQWPAGTVWQGTVSCEGALPHEFEIDEEADWREATNSVMAAFEQAHGRPFEANFMVVSGEDLYDDKYRAFDAAMGRRLRLLLPTCEGQFSVRGMVAGVQRTSFQYPVWLKRLQQATNREERPPSRLWVWLAAEVDCVQPPQPAPPQANMDAPAPEPALAPLKAED